MIKLENAEVLGWEAAVRGLRTSTHSCHLSDSHFGTEISDWDGKFRIPSGCYIGPKDYELILQLCNRGSIFARFKEMITVSVDITAPLYFWNEFHNFGVGKLGYPYSLLDRIHSKEFELYDFSCEHLQNINAEPKFGVMNEMCRMVFSPVGVFCITIDTLNEYRKRFLETRDKNYWWSMIQLLPMSYNETQTVQITYVEIADIYYACKDSKLDEFKELREWIRGLPYSEFITGEVE